MTLGTDICFMVDTVDKKKYYFFLVFFNITKFLGILSNFIWNWNLFYTNWKCDGCKYRLFLGRLQIATAIFIYDWGHKLWWTWWARVIYSGGTHNDAENISTPQMAGRRLPGIKTRPSPGFHFPLFLVFLSCYCPSRASNFSSLWIQI